MNSELNEKDLSSEQVDKLDEKKEIISNNIEKKETNNPDFKKVKSKKNLLIIGLLIIAAILIGLYFVIMGNPKNIFLREINKGYKNIEKAIENIGEVSNKINSDVILNKSNLSFDFKSSNAEYQSAFDEFNKIKLSLISGVDYKNKQLMANLALLSDKTEIINSSFYGTNKNFYIYLKDIFSEYIEIPYEEGYDQLFENENIDTKELNYILKTTKNSLINNLDKKDFKESKEKITVDDKKIYTNKISLAIDEKKANELLKDILTDISKDSKYITSLSTLLDITEEEIKSSLEKMITALESAETDGEAVLEINIYTKGILKDTIKYEIKIASEGNDVSLSQTEYKNQNIISLDSNETNILKITNTKESKQKSKIRAILSTITLDINCNNKKDIKNYDYVLKVDNKEIINGNVKVENKTVKKNEEYENNISATVNLKDDSSENLTLTINLSSNDKKVDSLGIPSLDPKVNYEELTETDITELQNGLENNAFLKSIIDSVSSTTDTENSYVVTSDATTVNDFIYEIEDAIYEKSNADSNYQIPTRVTDVSLAKLDDGKIPEKVDVTINQDFGWVEDGTIVYNGVTYNIKDGFIE